MNPDQDEILALAEEIYDKDTIKMRADQMHFGGDPDDVFGDWGLESYGIRRDYIKLATERFYGDAL